MIELFRRARENNIKLTDIFESPAELAQKLGVTLSEKTAKDLGSVAPAKLPEVADPIDREILGFFQKVAEEGSFLDTWSKRPHEVAQALKVNLSEPALERLVTGGAMSVSRTIGPLKVTPEIVAFGPTIVVVTVVAVIASFAPGSSDRSVTKFVEDRSGVEKI
jgi:hypothetical protein